MGKNGGLWNRGQGSPAIDGVKRTMWIFEPHVAELILILGCKSIK